MMKHTTFYIKDENKYKKFSMMMKAKDLDIVDGLWEAMEMYIELPSNKNTLEQFFGDNKTKAPVLSIYDNIVDMRRKLREYPAEEWHNLLNLYSVFYKEVNAENKRRNK